MNFTLNNQEDFKTDSAGHNINIGYKYHRYRPVANPSCFGESTYYAAIKTSNSYHVDSQVLWMKGLNSKQH
jgi:hypothetical protein